MRSVIRYSLLAWLVYTIFWIWIVSAYIELQPGITRTMSIILPQMGLFYLNLLYLIPEFLDRKSRLNYFVVVGTLVVLVVITGGLLDIYLDSLYPFPFHGQQERPWYSNFIARFFMSVMPLVVSALVSKSLQVRKQREESLELRNKMLEAESRALKAQINPHFLFNSLNNIYSLAQLKSDKTPDAILHLSDILRFVTYESTQDFVDLSYELKHIHSFIQLQYLKDEDQSNMQINIDPANGHFKIAPLLLIPFIENSFKHSDHEDKAHGWIKIDIIAKDGKISMTCENSISTKARSNMEKHGVGMENVKKRLALIYPGRHRLTIKDNLQSYKTELEIQLEK